MMITSPAGLTASSTSVAVVRGSSDGYIACYSGSSSVEAGGAFFRTVRCSETMPARRHSR